MGTCVWIKLLSHTNHITKYVLYMNSVLNNTLCPFHPVFRKGQKIKDQVCRKPLKTPKNFINMGTTTAHRKVVLIN